MLFRTIANTTTSSTGSSSTTCTQAAKQMLRESRDLLELVLQATKNVNDIGGLFMDELSSVIEKRCMHRRLERWVTERMTSDFQDNFIVDVESKDPAPPDNFIPMDLQYNLEFDLEDSRGGGGDVPDDDGIALNLCPLIIKSISPGQSSYVQSTLASKLIPHFRLLRMCVSAQNGGDLSDIDAVIGCPVWLPKRHVLEKFESLSNNEKNVVCATLFYCANWFRELINAFASHHDVQIQTDQKSKVLNRLKNLLCVQKDLSFCLTYHSSFVPPAVLHLIDTSSWQPPTGGIGGASGDKKAKSKKGKGKGKKSKKAATADDTAAGMTTNIDQTVAAGPSQMNNSAVDEISPSSSPSYSDRSMDLSHYAPFFRELDLATFNILAFGDVVLLSPPSEEEEARDPKLRPAELLFLLQVRATKYL